MFTLLLADDDPDSRLLVAHALRQSETFHIVGETAATNDAVSLASSLRPDIVMMDPVLPGGDGMWALPRIREAAPEAKVVLHSAFPASELSFAALSGGAVGYLEKRRSPLTLADDLLAVCGLLDVLEAGINKAKARLGANLQTPRLARRFVRRALERWKGKSEVDLVELLVSELVTNSLVHARSDVEVSVTVDSQLARVSVFDSSLEPPVRRAPGADNASGRGLLMLDALSSGWGVDLTPRGKSVWFEIKNDFH
jgi:DNA-binding NarL/FixJ family response regulator